MKWNRLMPVIGIVIGCAACFLAIGLLFRRKFTQKERSPEEFIWVG